MYCSGAAVPEKCVGNGSYFKKKKVWNCFSLSFSRNHFPGDVVSLPTPPNIQLVPPRLDHNRSMIFLARSLQLVVRPRIDCSIQTSSVITLCSLQIFHFIIYIGNHGHVILFYDTHFMFTDPLYVGSSTNTR